MARFLQNLLNAQEPLFTDALRELEILTGNNSADVKLIGDITALAHESMRKMGLNPATATGQEVYQALQARIEQDSKRLARIIGVKDPEDPNQVTPQAIKAAESIKFNRNLFVLKHETARNLLRQLPPNNLIKELGYSSVDEMVESEDVDEIYAALRFSEGPDWLNQFNELFESVKSDNFETRKMRILQLDHNKYVDLAASFIENKQHSVTHSKEMGVIAVLPPRASKVKGLVIKTLSQILHCMNELQMYASFFKAQTEKRHFGKIVSETLIAEVDTKSQTAGAKIRWRVIQKYPGRMSDSAIGSIPFEPHIHPEDIHWRKAKELLFDIDPGLEFWQGRDFVGVNFDGYPVSFNLVDVVMSHSNGYRYQDRRARYMRESLWNEIFIRYMGADNFNEQIFEELNNGVVKPELLPIPKLGQTRQEILNREKRQQRNLLIRQRAIDAAEGRLADTTNDMDVVFDVLGKFEKTVTIFGSARETVGEEVLTDSYDLAQRLASEGFAVVTGGGHGVMAAANKGAYDAGGDSIGLNILLPKEQTLNSYTTENYEFDHFFGRKVAMTLAASAYIFMPGGFGTMDEFFEILTLKQTYRIPPIPIILVGNKFWSKLDDFIKETLQQDYKTIEPADRKLYEILDDHATIIKRIESYMADQTHS